jgi:hypothetical protein
MMLPMSIRCNTCGNYIYKGARSRRVARLCAQAHTQTLVSALTQRCIAHRTGTKFNSRKEDAAGEDYLGVQIFRFYFKCPRCSAELAMKTDPKNSDYTVEAGATRNYEPWRDKDEQARALASGVRRQRGWLCLRSRTRRNAATLKVHALTRALPGCRWTMRCASAKRRRLATR